MTDPRTELTRAFAQQFGVPPLTAEEIEAVLVLASIAAHGTGDRTSAPVISFLAGLAAAGGDDRLAALDEARRRVAELAPRAE